MQKAYKLQGKHRHYDWGGTQFIPALMGVENKSNAPYAEYWMGAHPAAVSEITTEQGVVLLDKMLADNGAKLLGEKTLANFGTLPYLYKVLDVANMLSIQAHPNKQNAILGYEKEEAAGIDLNATARNYKDKNHKPEVMVALSDFWLLHGFLAPELLEARLKDFLYLNPLQAHFRGGNYEGLYRFFMQLSSEDADFILKPLMMDAVSSVKSGSVDKSHPHWWANKYYNGQVPDKNIDKGIFSIYILNILQVAQYEGVFQGAGLLHAYLEGQNIELMANSDNVLRGGLTTKHVDVNELIQQVKFIPTYPNVLKGEGLNEYETAYACPVPDFGLTKITLLKGKSYTINTNGLEMVLSTQGDIQLENIQLRAGEVVMLPAGQSVVLTANSDSVLFKSFVP
ncbi:MAG: mannose-6-phosphate isomerase, class I [Sediminibacterium sp.]|jgi:mannose-6-phosphate isomerase|nr:mannose-6-phosphate isomerase, class I [Sediminibacterium sp.]